MCINRDIECEADLTEDAVSLFEKWKKDEEFIVGEKIDTSKEQIEMFIENLKQVLIDSLL